MPQRENSRADLGNSKRASDTYDNNNIFLTDQGWVYRHWKGDPLTTDRYWDEILVAGQVNPEDRTVLGDFFEDSAPYQPTFYKKDDGTGTGTLVDTDRESDLPSDFYPLATGNQKYPAPGNVDYPTTPVGAYEPSQSDPGTPDAIFDIEYASHLYDGVEFPAKPAGDYMDHYENELTNDDGMVKPPGVEDLGYEQFPEVDPENPAAPPAPAPTP
jgi:hypothetical protein